MIDRYQAEDEDELSLEVGDVVQVIEYEDPEEQVRQVFSYCCRPNGSFLFTPFLLAHSTNNCRYQSLLNFLFVILSSLFFTVCLLLRHSRTKVDESWLHNLFFLHPPA